MRILHCLALSAALLLAGCASTPYAVPDQLPPAVQVPDGSPARTALNAQVYDAATRHVARHFYRRDFDRAQFAASAQDQRNDALRQPDEAGLYAALGALLRQLDDDHTNAHSPTQRARRQALRSGEASAGYGISLIRQGDDWRVRSVQDGSPAADAGILPGWRLILIDGVPTLDAPPPRDGHSATLVFIDDDGQQQSHALTARMQPAPTRYDTHLFDDGVLVLRFDRFDATSLAWLRERIDALAAAPPPALILDLRDNGGGLLHLATEANALFHDTPQAFATVHSRWRDQRYRAEAPPHPYLGPLAVLVGPATASSAELLAARLGETGRAVRVGQPTRGAVVGTHGINLPDGGLLYVGMRRMSTADGAELEKVGVIPELLVDEDWPALRAGRDPVLEAARAALAALP